MSQEVVVFDLDGTLLSADSTKTWLTQQLKSNRFRFCIALCVLPIAISLMQIKRFKGMGASLFLWVATLGLSEQQLKAQFSYFAHHLKNIHWFKDGLTTLKQHLAKNRRVIVVTAAPEWLAQALIHSLGLDIEVLGTPLRHKFGGWIGGKHCRHQEKVNRLNIIGVTALWLSTYSDDLKDDYPILISSQNAYLINSLKKSEYCQNISWS